MSCPVCGPGPPRKRKKAKRRARQADAEAWSAVAAAVALLTNERARSGVSVAELLGDCPPEQVIQAQAIVTAAMLDVLAPDAGSRVLRRLGLNALARATRLPARAGSSGGHVT